MPARIPCKLDQAIALDIIISVIFVSFGLYDLVQDFLVQFPAAEVAATVLDFAKVQDTWQLGPWFEASSRAVAGGVFGPFSSGFLSSVSQEMTKAG